MTDLLIARQRSCAGLALCDLDVRRLPTPGILFKRPSCERANFPSMLAEEPKLNSCCHSPSQASSFALFSLTLRARSLRVRFELSNTPSLYSVHVLSSDSCEAASRLMTICFDDADFLRAGGFQV